MPMLSSPRLDRSLRLFLHTLGISCIGGAVFLQTMVFADIAQRGYFTAIERNPAILTLEVGLTGFGIAYFAYTYQKLIRQMRR